MTDQSTDGTERGPKVYECMACGAGTYEEGPCHECGAGPFDKEVENGDV